MGPLTHSKQVYHDLADTYERLGQVTMRDRFLMLAADAALQLGDPHEAERLRQRLLAGSRHHMLRPYASFAEAASAPDVQTYLRDLRLNYPPDVAEQMLAGMSGGAAERLDQTQPLPPMETPRSLPMTAPLMDMAGPPAARARQIRPLVPDAETYPLAAPTPPKPRSPAERPPAPDPYPLAAPVPLVPPKPRPAERRVIVPAEPVPPEPLPVERVVPAGRTPRNPASW
ncbi:MAG: hypothetical protein ACRC33_20660, partial [Gemmataceae bacterium]